MSIAKRKRRKVSRKYSKVWSRRRRLGLPMSKRRNPDTLEAMDQKVSVLKAKFLSAVKDAGFKNEFDAYKLENSVGWPKALKVSFDRYIEALHRFYRKRDGPHGFLGGRTGSGTVAGCPMGEQRCHPTGFEKAGRPKRKNSGMNSERYEVQNLITGKFTTVRTSGGPGDACNAITGGLKRPRYQKQGDVTIVWDRSSPSKKFAVRKIH